MNHHRRMWIVGLDALVLAPLVGAAASPMTRRSGALVNVSAGLGLASTSLLAVVALLVSRIRGLTRALGLELVADLHRRLAVGATALALAHVVLAVPTHPLGLRVLDPWVAPGAARAAIGATLVLLAIPTVVVPTTAGRRYTLRARLHGLLAVVVLVLVGVHVVLLRRLVADPLVALPLTGSALVVLVVLARRWALRPLLDQDAFLVRAVRSESPGTSTVVLVPAHRWGSMTFEPGQFVWMRLGREVATSDEHPFTVADTAHAQALELTVRERGEFTGALADLAVGRRVWLDGPHGALVPPGIEVSRRGLVLIAGGVGITPIISILRAFAAAGDPRELRLLLAERPRDALFPHEIETLCRRLPLTVTRVAGRRIDAAVLTDVLPDDESRLGYDYYLCGPPSMLGTTLGVLDALGVPHEHVHTERFG